MDAETLWKKSLKKAILSPGNVVTGAVGLAASAILWNPLPLILWGLGSSGWSLLASTGEGFRKKVLEEERQAQEAKVAADREALRLKVENALVEQPVSGWVYRGLIPDYLQAYRRLVEVRDRIARLLRDRAADDPMAESGILPQLDYMLGAYLQFVRERVLYLHILASIRPLGPGTDAAPPPAPAPQTSGPPAGYSTKRWDKLARVKTGGPPPPPEPAPAVPTVEQRLAEVDDKIQRLKVLAEQEPATARTREWHIGILQKQRDLLLECQKRDQCVVAQLGAFSDVFEVILGRVSASQFSATEVASYMGSVVEQIEETERFLESLRPAMDQLAVGAQQDLTRWATPT